MITWAIIIPTHNRADLLEQCLKHVRLLKVPEVVQLKVVVVCDGCTDRSLMVALDWANIVRTCDFKSAAAARNAGAAEVPDADIYMFLDDDNMLTPDILVKQLDIFVNNADIVMIGYYQKPIVTTWVTRLEKFAERLAGMGVPIKDFIIEEGQMFACTFQGYAWRKTSGYDITMAIGEDTELCDRVYLATGGQCYIMADAVPHHQTYDCQHFLKLAYQRGLGWRRAPAKLPWLKLFLLSPLLVWRTSKKILTYRSKIKFDI